MKKYIILIILLNLINHSLANEIKVEVNIIPEILLGVPFDIYVDIINLEDESLYLISNIEKGGFWISYFLYEEDSGKIVECHTDQFHYAPGYSYEEIKPRGIVRKYLFSIELCDIKAGKYILDIYISSKADPPKEKGIINYWKGEIKIKETFEIKQPKWIDLEAYNYFEGHPLWKKEELLQKYPTSTYAGWALLNNKAEIGRPEDAIAPSFTFFNFPEPYESRMKRSRDNWPSITKEYIEKLENYLRSRPDFPLKEIMLYKIAYQYAYFMKYDKAKEIANSLVKEGKNQKVVEYSKRLINLIETGYYQNKIEEIKKQLQKDYWEKKK